MASTFLGHYKQNEIGLCQGNIVIDASTSAKLIAPSFSVNTGGLGKLVLDIQIAPGNRLDPAYQCTKCGEIVNKDSLGTELTAICQICGDTKLAGEINVHSQITTICNECIEKIKDFSSSTEERVKDYIEMYSLTKNIRVVPLVKVLLSPINL